MSNDKLNRDGVKALWDRVFDLIGIITGDVDVKNKGTLQEQVNGVSTRVEECFTSVSNGKKAVANAITGKGISTAEDAEFATMAENIGKIKSTPKLQSKSAALNTGTTSVTMKPDTGYDGLSQATASIVLQEKAATLKTSAQNITPDSGKLLSKVSVPAVPGNAALTNVLAGKTFSSETAGVGKTGTMANKAGTTVKASAVSQDDNNTYLTIPAAGYYDTTSKVYTENSNLGSKSYILSSSSTFSSATGTTLTYDLPSDITDTKNWRVAVLLPFSYSLPYIGVGYNHGSRVMSASFTDNRKVVVTLPLYSTNNKNGVDDEFALVLENLTVALVYVE